jgi:hypothetical protein
LIENLNGGVICKENVSIYPVGKGRLRVVVVVFSALNAERGSGLPKDYKGSSLHYSPTYLPCYVKLS